LWFSPARTTSLRSPSEPSGSTRNFGTMNSEMPFTPGGPPGILARTRWTMFSVSSWSPPEIHILLPVSRYVPSSCGTAFVVMSASDEPACGSDSAIVPNQRPSISGRT
jgi:hypothetical protein